MKTLLSILAVVFLMSCATVPVDRPMPGWVQYLQDNIQGVRIIDWRQDDALAWVWCDNFDMPGDCDYVAVLEIFDLDNNEYSGMYFLNKDNLPPGSDVCKDAYEIYEMYLEGVKDYEREGAI